eukprot:CAMPEP_0184856544 /NCGR_PEP_ID=MMETSP0580-20130426/1743_1 /TAXON_ID=1118495 /ORGANISM="Dactyliosolen fragilissimus" /LENGTH=82 /DNA_ID=CAMNT_0027351641 /DNA_START=57 /DNA_END=301 /DNA_ORIENTATION=-
MSPLLNPSATVNRPQYVLIVLIIFISTGFIIQRNQLGIYKDNISKTISVEIPIQDYRKVEVNNDNDNDEGKQHESLQTIEEV